MQCTNTCNRYESLYIVTQDQDILTVYSTLYTLMKHCSEYLKIVFDTFRTVNIAGILESALSIE